jgi:predicted TIM-barrel fold metal-dependent hydrolase
MHSDLNRRGFIRRSAMFSALAAGFGQDMETAFAGSSESIEGTAPEPARSAADLPMFCAHEHWGSIAPIGFAPGGFRADAVQGARPVAPVHLLHLFLDPYFGGMLHSSGVDVVAAMKEATGCKDPMAEFRDRPAVLWRAFIRAVGAQRLTGTFQCIRHGIIRLYGIDPTDASDQEIADLNQSVERNYSDLFGWYVRAMDTAHFSGLIRPVHPEFFAREESAAAARQERRFTRPILRIDPLLELWKPESERRGVMSEMVDVEPADAASWRAFLDELFSLAQAGGNVGIKQLQAYSRDLDFRPRTDEEVKFRGALTSDEVRCFQDWVVHECCKRANDLGWPHQVHVGTHNLAESSPLPLERLARRYTSQKLVFLHCWPFIEESGFLAKMQPNIYLDPCWQPILSPDFLDRSFETWLRYVPAKKLMLSNDATTVEMAAGASQYARSALGRGLENAASNAGVEDEMLRAIAADILEGNAKTVYPGCN